MNTQNRLVGSKNRGGQLHLYRHC
ncbi:hypothetical protein DC345_05280 [Paenibacillus taichungensis]|uniref:Uncharacterized protein n=1 Tax=Paenibacillus taichungensis TaxID=484184 RepID=A0A329R1D3_9BACL|nr:hypothetical protein DC345_05280 [Paenibacillus taichungensis]